MSGNGDTDFTSRHLLDLVSDLIGNGRILIVSHFLLVFLLGELRVFLGNGAFRDRNDGKSAAALVPAFNSLNDLIDIIGDFRDQDYIRAARDTRVQRQPAHLVAHDLNNKYTAVGTGGSVDLVDRGGRDIYSTLETKGHFCSPQIIVDGLGKRDYIEALLAEQIGSLGGTVAAAHDQAVQLQFMIGLFHSLYLVEAVLIRITDGLERAAAGSQNRAASGQDSLEVLAGQDPEFAVDQALVAVFEAVKLNRLFRVIDDALINAAHRRVQGLAVTSAGKKTDS